MTDTSTFGHMLIGFQRLLQRQQARVQPLPVPEQPPQLQSPPEPDKGESRRKRRIRQQTKPSLAKRKARRKIRNRMARQSRRMNRK